MKNLLLLAGAAVMASGCDVMAQVHGPQIVGSGKVISVNRPIGPFKAVKLDGAMDADITIGGQSDIKIEGDDNIVPKIKTEVKGDTLRIYMENGSYSTKNPVRVSFSVPKLEAAAVNGSGDMAIRGYRGESLSLAINGSGDVKADGEAKAVVATINGSGDFGLFGLKASDVNVSIHGSGDAEVNATSSLEAAIAGSGDIRYKGHPQINKAVAGSGGVTDAN